ncbi:DUF3653 domain-containing protein (plasmid) [Photobacterium sp. SP02]|uniref:Regulator n=2 Tax=Photobacterium arenosum TaxID=2774143 RepID=A0ABR9BSC7_9GAMM|nr:DUF3653 domain-containing protein [Photobacterium arenosum]MBD8514461.1 regulator [Photobacterium arenosum]
MTRKITENYIFRRFVCGLSRDETAKLCFKSVRTVTRWDSGQTIPPECRRLMKLYSNREITTHEAWNGWRISKEGLITPNGWCLTPDRILTGHALLEIGAETDSKNNTLIIKTARLLKGLPHTR